MLTADTITDEQIRELRKDAIAGVLDGDCEFVARKCDTALHNVHPPHKRAARARCAEILNARAKEQS